MYKKRLPVTFVSNSSDVSGSLVAIEQAVTETPIKFLGVGEKIDELDAFDARRVAGSILGQGDVVGLVERAAQVIDQEEAEAQAKKMLKGQFTLEDMADQIGQLRKQCPWRHGVPLVWCLVTQKPVIVRRMP